MKVFAVLALVAAATVVSADTNAQRLARGLSPNAPGKRATPVEAARRSAASGSPNGQCNTGSNQCCHSVQTNTGSAGELTDLLNLVGATVPIGTAVGLSCTGIGGTGSSCEQQPVCCQGNNFSGLVVVGCSPININA